VKPSELDLWEKEWAEETDTLTWKNVFYLMDEIQSEYLEPLLTTKGRILEVGSGSGRVSLFMSRRLSLYPTFVDYSRQALRVARNNCYILNQEADFVLADAHHIPFRDDCFDAVLSVGLLEHFKDPQPIVNEMVRVLKEGGLFYSNVAPKKFSTLKSLDFLVALVTGAGDKEHFEGKYSKEMLSNFLQRAGLDDVTVFPAGVFPPTPPLLYRSQGFRRLESYVLYMLKGLWKCMDRSWIARLIGFYYFAYGYKPKRSLVSKKG
jgi:ubiquinone/menaquinone biosynthesis C-methylase UbiE